MASSVPCTRGPTDAAHALQWQHLAALDRGWTGGSGDAGSGGVQIMRAARSGAAGWPDRRANLLTNLSGRGAIGAEAALDEDHADIPADEHDGGRARPVLLRHDECRRQQPLPGETDPGARQQFIARLPAIGQQREEVGDELGPTAAQQRVQGALARRHLRPCRIEQVIAEPIDARAKRAGTALAVGEVEELARVAGDQVEPVVQRRVTLDPLEMRAHADVRLEIVADQESAGTGRGGLALALAVVGDGGKAPGPIDAQPGSSGLEIPSAQNFRDARARTSRPRSGGRRTRRGWPRRPANSQGANRARSGSGT